MTDREQIRRDAANYDGFAARALAIHCRDLLEELEKAEEGLRKIADSSFDSPHRRIARAALEAAT